MNIDKTSNSKKKKNDKIQTNAKQVNGRSKNVKSRHKSMKESGNEQEKLSRNEISESHEISNDNIQNSNQEMNDADESNIELAEILPELSFEDNDEGVDIIFAPSVPSVPSGVEDIAKDSNEEKKKRNKFAQDLDEAVDMII